MELPLGPRLRPDDRPDVGTARVDFPGGSAESLYNSVQRVLSLEQNVRVFSGEIVGGRVFDANHAVQYRREPC